MAIGFSRDGVHVDANPAYVRLFGYATAAELIGTPILDLIAPSARRDVVEKIAQRVRGARGPETYDTVGLKKGGTEFPFQVHTVRVVLEDGPLSIASIHDLTDRKRVEEASREAIEFQSQLLAVSPAVIVAYEAHGAGRCVVANDAAATLVGTTPERLLEQSFRELASWKNSGLLDLAEAALRTGVVQKDEVELRTSFGRNLVMSSAFVPFDSGGKRHLLLVGDDVTEARRAAVALERSEERLRLVLEAADRAIWDFDLATGESHVSPSAFTLLGLAPEEARLELERLLGLLVPEDAARARRAFVDEGGDARELEVRFRTRDGTLRWLLVRGRVVERDAAGAARRVVGTLADITDRKRAEEERRRFDERLRHAQKLESLGVLAGGVAHDFNNLLTVILANADLAQRSLPAGMVASELQAIIGAGARAAELSRQMLAYSGRGRLEVAPLDFPDLVREMLQILEASISKKATLSCTLPPRLPAVTADASQLRQVVMNLVLNASEALGEASGSIEVTLGSMECDRAYFARTVLDEERPEGTYLFLEVADSGCGMTAETQARMFDPFFTTKFTGRGLGMAAVLGIVRGHRGAIEVQSDPGRGTRIRVLLPACEAPARREPVPLAVKPGRRGCGTILVADDEPGVRRSTAALLANIGFELLLACDGREAVDLVRAHRDEIACVLLDLTMPVMDGVEALEEIRRLAPAMPIVVSSGYGEPHAAARLVAYPEVPFIAKPYMLAALTSALEGAIARGR
jgi:PAS domain S-box-containing protein